jgi:hypothetical protein
VLKTLATAPRSSTHEYLYIYAYIYGGDKKSSVSESNAIDFMADGGPARQPGKPGKRALCIEEGGQQGEAVNGKNSRNPLKQIKMLLIAVHLAKRGKIK